MRLEVDITRNDASPLLRRVLETFENRRPVHEAMAQGGSRVMQRHFQRKASSNRNRLGAKSTFWNRMLSGVRAQADDSEATVAVPGEIAQRYFGGTITPKRRKYLSIPARTEAYGNSPREFNDLRFIPLKSGSAMLVRNYQSDIRTRQLLGGEVMYWLVRSVTQAGDKSVLPEESELVTAAVDAAEGFLARRLQSL